jgi:hypothetical protein
VQGVHLFGRCVTGPAQWSGPNRQAGCSPLRSLPSLYSLLHPKHIASCDRNFPSPCPTWLHRAVRLPHSASPPLPSPTVPPSRATPHFSSPIAAMACTSPPPPWRHQEKVIATGTSFLAVGRRHHGRKPRHHRPELAIATAWPPRRMTLARRCLC